MSNKKLRKTNKRNHWGRGGNFLKGVLKGKGIVFYNSTERRLNKNLLS